MNKNTQTEIIEQLKFDLKSAKRDLKYWKREALDSATKIDRLESETYPGSESDFAKDTFIPRR